MPSLPRGSRLAISIHALRGEGDDIPPESVLIVDISIHALRGEGDIYKYGILWVQQNFYPRPPWGGRHISFCNSFIGREISIHALRGEGDGSPSLGVINDKLFLSTPSVGRATLGKVGVSGLAVRISIHALRGEGDAQCP